MFLHQELRVVLRWGRHRALQLIQKTFYSGTAIFCPLRTIPLRLVLGCRCQCDAWVGSILMDIVGNTAGRQWRCSIFYRKEVSKYNYLFFYVFSHNQSIINIHARQYIFWNALSVSSCLPVVEKDGAFCCTALSSRRRRSSSDRLLPRADVMAVADESECFCLLGKLDQ